MKSTEFIQRFEKREDLKRVAPGQFRESTSTDRVFFVEGSTGGSTVVQNVFVNTNEEGRQLGGGRQGRRDRAGRQGRPVPGAEERPPLPGRPGQADFQSMEFERYRMRVSTGAGDRRRHPGRGALAPAMLAAKDNRSPTPNCCTASRRRSSA
jgi:lipopolysaccharide export system permease protein